MNSIFRNLPLSHKLLSVIMVTCGGALLLACIVILLYDLLLYRQDMSAELSVQADIIGANSTMALAQHNPALANQTLQALRYQPSITKATIYTKDGRVFATYTSHLASPATPLLPRSKDFGRNFLNLSLVREIMDAGDRVGTIVIEATLDKVLQRWMAFGAIVGGVLFASSLFAFLLSHRLQALISDPILRLTSLAQRVSSEKNYSLREAKTSQDEIGTLIDGFNDMLEQIQHRDRQLQKHREDLEDLVAHRTAELGKLHRQVELILDTAGEGIIGLDDQGRAIFVNAAASRMIGWSTEELLGQPLHEYIHPRKADGSPCPARECPLRLVTVGDTATGSGNHEVFWRKDRTWFPVEYLSAPIRDDQGLVTGAVMTFRDVTDRKRFEAALFEAVQAAEQANQAKSRFLANMSHEIRTPMNGLLGMAELLLKTQQTPKQRRFAESLHRSGQHLLHIINDILDFSKIEADKLELEHLDFPLHQTIEDTVQVFAEPAQKKGLELICHIESTVPFMAQGDPGRLRQILTNLIGNAIKFTSQGEVAIRASVSTDEENAFELHVEVLDTGIGIPSGAQSKIFEAFSQADSSTTRKFGGTGLGLTITKKLAELMGGRLSFLSEEGKGSSFAFTVPFKKIPPAASPDMATCPLHGLNILVVEDNHRNQLALTDLTNRWGAHTHLANDGKRALRFLNEHRASPRPLDVIIIDYTLPDMDGIALAGQIKADSAYASIPLVLLTPWHIPEEEARRAALAGFQQPILKPVRQADLYDRLQALTNTQPSPPDSSRLVESPPAQNALSPASVLLAEDNQVNREIVKAMADHLGIHLEIVNNGIEAINAIAQHPYDLVLMDWQMPEMDGLEATREIRKRETTRDKLQGPRSKGKHEIPESSFLEPCTLNLAPSHIPIIAITAHASPQDRRTCLDAGTDDVLPKPFTLEQLQATLAQWLPAPRRIEESARPAEGEHMATPSPTGHSARDLLDPSPLDQIRALQRPEAPSLVEKVLTRYLTNTPKLLSDLQNALQQTDTSLLHHAAHTLKSSSANVGAMRLSEKCKELERLTRSSRSPVEMESLVHDITTEYETVRPLLVARCSEEHS